MGSFTDAVAKVKHAYDLAEYVGRVVSLSPSGVNLQVGLCPFHVEKTGSFTINSTTQSYRCYGCGAHGDLIQFVQDYEGMGFMDALTSLAQEKNIELDLDGADDGERIDYVSLRKCVRDAALFYVKAFRRQVARKNTHHAGLKQILDRDLPLDTSGKYGLASEAQSGLCKYLSGLGYSDALIEQAGLGTRYDSGKMVDFFRDRLMFTITDAQGRPIGFTGRLLHDNPKAGKYVNTKETPLFNKRNVLYNFASGSHSARRLKTIYVVEGQFDVRAVTECGLENVVAASGTSFTVEHGNKCRSVVGSDGKIVFVFDGDSAGMKTARKIVENMPQIQMNAYAVAMPAGVDPCDYRQQHGNDELRDLLENNIVELAEFVVRGMLAEADLSSATSRARFVDDVAPLIKAIRSRSLRESQARYVALHAQTSYESVLEAVEQAKSGTPVKQSIADDTDTETAEVGGNKLYALIATVPPLKASAQAIRLAIENPEFVSMLAPLKVEGSPFLSIIERLEELGGNSAIVPEDFADPDLVKHIMRLPLFSYPDMPQSVKRDHVSLLVEYVVRKRRELKHERGARKILQALPTEGESGQLLEEAVRRLTHITNG